jgi:hypothetical protein
MRLRSGPKRHRANPSAAPMAPTPAVAAPASPPPAPAPPPPAEEEEDDNDDEEPAVDADADADVSPYILHGGACHTFCMGFGWGLSDDHELYFN